MSENTRYVPAEKAFIAGDGTTSRPMWGVLDNETGLFAPFGGDELLAAYAAEKVAEKPGAGWDFVPVATPAPRFEWIKATYTEFNGESATAFGAVDNELGRFFPFSDSATDPDAASFVADVEAWPGKYTFVDTFTRN